MQKFTARAEPAWEDVRHQKEGGASEGRGWEALCLKMYGEPLENIKQGDNLLVVRFEAGHLIFPILHYLVGDNAFPTYWRTWKFSSEIISHRKIINVHLRDYDSGPLCISRIKPPH